MQYEYLKALYRDVQKMVDVIEVKRPDLAKANETFETYKAYELYEACLAGDTNILNFEIDRKTLAQYISADKVPQYINNLLGLPKDIQNIIVNDLSDKVIANYEEKNEYYRMLSGLPELEDKATDFIYVRNMGMVEHGIPEDVPVHKLTIEQIDILESYGVLATLKAKYPKKYYLNYLGIHAINALEARRAKDFEILRLGVPDNLKNRETFMGEYYGARRYVLATMYNDKMFYNSRYYHATVGIIMLMLAIRNMMVPTESMYLSFEEIIDSILESYGVLQYFKRLPFSYKRKLAIAMDRLLMIKGTDQVLVDLCKLFAYDNLIANRYYLAKVPVRDENGKIKIVRKDDGTLDYDKMYDLKFIKSDISNKDIDFNPEDFIDYETVVSGDPLWQLTDEEEAKFKADGYNIMMSKYISIEAAYELSNLTYETNYFINLLLNNRQNAASIRTTNMYSTSGYTTLYGMLMFLLSAFAKRSGYDGNIVYDPEGVADVYGFDVDELKDVATSVVNNTGNPYTVKGKNTKDLSVDTLFQTRGKLMQFNYNPDITDMKRILELYEIEDIDVSSLVPKKPEGSLTTDQFVDIYVTNTNIYRMITEEMKTTTNYKRYEALSQIKKILFTSEYTAKNFTKSDGTLAETYRDMLDDIDPKLGQKLDSIEEDDEDELDQLILYILQKLEVMFDSKELKYLFLNTPGVAGTLITKYLRTAIELFKASSVEFSTINIVFEYGDEVPIRVIDRNVLWVKKVTNEDIFIDDEIGFHKYLFLDDFVNVEPKIYIQ